MPSPLWGVAKAGTCTAAAIALLSGCSASQTSPSSSLAATTTLTSASLYQEFVALDPAARAAAFVQLGNMNFSQYYEFLAANVSAAAFSVDGVAVSGGAERLLSERSSILGLQTQYPNLKAMWSSFGVSDAASISEADFTTGIHNLLQQTQGLALAGQDCNQTTALQKRTPSMAKKTYGTIAALNVQTMVQDTSNTTTVKTVTTNAAGREVAGTTTIPGFQRQIVAGNPGSSNWQGRISEPVMGADGNPTIGTDGQPLVETTLVTFFQSGSCKMTNVGHMDQVMTHHQYDPSALNWGSAPEEGELSPVPGE